MDSSDSFVLVIFGITSNLSQLKLLPALYKMAENNLLPPSMSIIGVARSPMEKDQFIAYIKMTLEKKLKINDQIFNSFCQNLFYLNGHLDDPHFYPRLDQFMHSLTSSGRSCKNRIYYLATYPTLYQTVFENLYANYLNDQKEGWVRLMIEKPLGNDFTSAHALNTLLKRYFGEDQIYRLDHYLGKETIQNILTFRFSNSIFEPLTSNQFIDHIQITSAEDFGIGKRGGYYDSVGAMRDVGQNHLLQMLSFATMDSPATFGNEDITRERLKILENLTPLPQKVVFGQYEGYRSEEKVFPDSTTDTFFALKTYINQPRFEGIPIYIRAGKKLKQTVTEIVIVFKNPHNSIMASLPEDSYQNKLIYRIQPNEGIVLEVLTKKPGHTLELIPEFMQLCYRLDSHKHYFPDPYEKLLTDTIRGDQTFFNDAREIEAQWKFVDPLVQNQMKPFSYAPGSWGPKEADMLIEEDGRKWIEPSMEFCRI